MSTNPSNQPPGDQWWYCGTCRRQVDRNNSRINGACPGCGSAKPPAESSAEYEPHGYRTADGETTLFGGAPLQTLPGHRVAPPPSSHANYSIERRARLTSSNWPLSNASTRDAPTSLPAGRVLATASQPATPATAGTESGKTPKNPGGRRWQCCTCGDINPGGDVCNRWRCAHERCVKEGGGCEFL